MGSVRLYGATSGYLELQAPDVSPDSTLVLPSDSLQPGLVHIHTESFSAKSSVSVDDVFSAEYENYRILVVGVGSTSQGINLRMRVSGSDASGSDYSYQGLSANNATVGAGSSTGTSWSGFVVFTTANMVADLLIFRPNLASNSQILSQTARQDYLQIAGGYHNQATAYDGFSLIAASGTISGSIRIYGYRNN